MKSTIGEYSILPLTLPAVPSYPEKHLTHTLYLRSHTPKIPTEDDSRSLFVINVPIDATRDHLKLICKDLIGPGRFEDVQFEEERKSKKEGRVDIVGKKRKRGDDPSAEEETELCQVWDRVLRRSGGTAIILFVDAKSVELFLKAVKKLQKQSAAAKWPVWGKGIEGKIPLLGEARYRSHHQLRFPDPKELQNNVDTFMEAFNRREEEDKERDRKRFSEPDEDGFVTVTKSSRSGVVRREVAEAKRKEVEEKEKRKKEELEKAGFYRFQGRERRKAESEKLVKAFEEDKKKVAGLREKRGKFRPES